MILFVSGSPEPHYAAMKAVELERFAGQMSCPFARNDVRRGVALGMPWCLDNGCFNRYSPSAIVSVLLSFRGVPGCVFVPAPDVVGNHAATLELFRQWIPIYTELDYPAAFVLQDGIDGEEDVPWDDIAAVFIGGSDKFKYSDVVRHIVTEANRRGKWAHMGRVNTFKRIVYAASIGCDSVDGTRYQRFKDAYKFAPAFEQRQMNLHEVLP